MIGVVGALVIGILAFVGVYYHKYRRRKPTILELGSTSLYTDSEHEPRKLV
jgi:hypothetical protein